jgi:hypothetical protein
MVIDTKTKDYIEASKSSKVVNRPVQVSFDLGP